MSQLTISLPWITWLCIAAALLLWALDWRGLRKAAEDPFGFNEEVKPIEHPVIGECAGCGGEANLVLDDKKKYCFPCAYGAATDLDAIEFLRSNRRFTFALQEEVALADCPVGLFFSGEQQLCLKTEYGDDNGRVDAYIVSSGEMFWGCTNRPKEQRMVRVRPVELKEDAQ